MADPSQYEYPSPLENYEHFPPLPHEKMEDGKSYFNPQSGVLSRAYEQFIDPIDKGKKGGFDVHVYFYQENKTQSKFAHDLWRRIRHEFPELRIYGVWDKPIGPHPVGMFEVNVFTPAQFGAFIAWLVINRGPLSALVHPNTGDDERDHTQRAIWMGDRIPLDLSIFRQMREAREKLGKEHVKA
ncbi:hypothetical protein N7G274_004083 [Stereocaulon virgatum]|uniref:Uncharacterized protein n=1 Tax=Stereocaulon virgatum TaxID=373712 RepID=A0ABR4AE82_9LECA